MVENPSIRADYDEEPNDRGKDRGPLHIVSAWASSQRLMLGQQVCEAKFNKITANPLLLERTALTGALVTMPAMRTQTKVAPIILDGGGDRGAGCWTSCSTRISAACDTAYLKVSLQQSV